MAKMSDDMRVKMNDLFRSAGYIVCGKDIFKMETLDEAGEVIEERFYQAAGVATGTGANKKHLGFCKARCANPADVAADAYEAVGTLCEIYGGMTIYKAAMKSIVIDAQKVRAANSGKIDYIRIVTENPALFVEGNPEATKKNCKTGTTVREYLTEN